MWWFIFVFCYLRYYRLFYCAWISSELYPMHHLPSSIKLLTFRFLYLFYVAELMLPLQKCLCLSVYFIIYMYFLARSKTTSIFSRILMIKVSIICPQNDQNVSMSISSHFDMDAITVIKANFTTYFHCMKLHRQRNLDPSRNCTREENNTENAI